MRATPDSERCAQREGIVAKWARGIYHTDGTTTSWLKVKNPDYSQMAVRHEVFEERGGKAPPCPSNTGLIQTRGRSRRSTGDVPLTAFQENAPMVEPEWNYWIGRRELPPRKSWWGLVRPIGLEPNLRLRSYCAWPVVRGGAKWCKLDPCRAQRKKGRT
jgi:hypothetical protein